MKINDLSDLGPVGLWSRFTDGAEAVDARLLARRYEQGGFPCVGIPEGLGHEALTHASLLLRDNRPRRRHRHRQHLGP